MASMRCFGVTLNCSDCGKIWRRVAWCVFVGVSVLLVITAQLWKPITIDVYHTTRFGRPGSPLLTRWDPSHINMAMVDWAKLIVVCILALLRLNFAESMEQSHLAYDSVAQTEVAAPAETPPTPIAPADAGTVSVALDPQSQPQQPQQQQQQQQQPRNRGRFGAMDQQERESLMVVCGGLTSFASHQSCNAVALLINGYMIAHICGLTGDLSLLFYFIILCGLISAVESGRLNSAHANIKRKALSPTRRFAIFIVLSATVVTVAMSLLAVSIQELGVLTALALVQYVVVFLIYVFLDLVLHPSHSWFMLLLDVLTLSQEVYMVFLLRELR